MSFSTIENVCFFDSKDRVIELYDVRDLRKTAHTYHVDPDRPGIMCTSSPYTLLYADSSKYVKPQDVTALDCRTSRPVYKGTTHTRYPSNSDMCCARDGDKSLLVTSYSHQGDEESGIYAYNRWVSMCYMDCCIKHRIVSVLMNGQPNGRSLLIMSHKLRRLNETSTRNFCNRSHAKYHQHFYIPIFLYVEQLVTLISGGSRIFLGGRQLPKWVC